MKKGNLRGLIEADWLADLQYLVVWVTHILCNDNNPKGLRKPGTVMSGSTAQAATEL